MFSRIRIPFAMDLSSGVLAAFALLLSSCGEPPQPGDRDGVETKVRPSGLVEGGARWDPIEALEKLSGTSPAECGARALRIYRRWAEGDGEAAVCHAEAHGQNVASASLREAFAGWLSSDAAGARAWVAGVPEGRRRLRLATALGEALPAARDRADWAAQLGESDCGSKVLSRAMCEWGRGPSSADAFGWLEANGGIDGRSREMGDLVRAWAERDPAAAALAIESLPSGVGRDAAVTALVTVIAPGQVVTARSWAETVGDENRRTELLALVAKIGGAGAPSLQP